MINLAFDSVTLALSARDAERARALGLEVGMSNTVQMIKRIEVSGEDPDSLVVLTRLKEKVEEWLGEHTLGEITEKDFKVKGH